MQVGLKTGLKFEKASISQLHISAVRVLKTQLHSTKCHHLAHLLCPILSKYLQRKLFARGKQHLLLTVLQELLEGF